MKGKYVIIDLKNMDYMKDDLGKIKTYKTLEEALETCGMYEFSDVWVCKLEHNYIE